MTTFEQAREIAIRHLHRRKPSDLMLDESRTVELSMAWVFYWNDRRWLIDRDYRYDMMGHKPFAVTKDTGQCLKGFVLADLRSKETMEAAVARLLSRHRGNDENGPEKGGPRPIGL